MNPDRWKKDLLDSLCLEREADAALQGMLRAGRQRRTRRRLCAAAGGMIAVSALLLVVGRSFQKAEPHVAAIDASIPGGASSRPPQQQSRMLVHQLSEPELRQRLRETSVAVAYVGPPGARRVILLEERK